jgi:acyl-coenzyme A synthetase/AMP-(fatty) acid ligase
VVAFVVPTVGAEPDGDAIIGRLRDQLARFKCPREIRFVETLPRNALGKVERYRLRESDA